jgi:shikimate kinase
MRLSLIGMSGSGKTSWSMILEKEGFKRFCCDDLIAEKLRSELTKPDGTVLELGDWMGFPFDSGYRERESRYLACEIEVLQEIMEYLESQESRSVEKIVVDTTGSVIYTGDKVLERLRHNTKIVHLATPPSLHGLMLEAYLANKRPVLWRDLYCQLPGETGDDALARCYPELLSTRERLYERYGDIAVDYEVINQPGFNFRDLLNAVDKG